jgi:hypothetical protein
MTRLLLLACILVCGAARAETIVIDPDLYSVGTDLSHLFPVVTLINGYGDPVDAALSPAAALDPNVFGVGSQNKFGYFVGPPGPNSPPLIPNASFSFLALFNQPVESATFRLFETAGGIGTQYSIYDSSGHIMSSGHVGPLAGVAYDATLDLTGAAGIAIGGEDSIANTSIDLITIQTLPTPLPDSGVLFGSGLLLAFFLGRKALRLPAAVDLLHR